MQALEGKEKGRISIHAQQDEHISIDIADNGPGIPPELQEKIFIPFFTINMKNCFAGIAFLNGEMPVVKADNLFA